MKQPGEPRRASEPALGVAWYRESDWPRVKALFPDANDLHDTYREWLQSAESLVRHLRQNNVAVEPYAIDLDHFIGWCLARDLSPDAEARAAYVAEMLAREKRADKAKHPPPTA